MVPQAREVPVEVCAVKRLVGRVVPDHRGDHSGDLAIARDLAQDLRDERLGDGREEVANELRGEHGAMLLDQLLQGTLEPRPVEHATVEPIRLLHFRREELDEERVSSLVTIDAKRIVPLLGGELPETLPVHEGSADRVYVPELQQ